MEPSWIGNSDRYDDYVDMPSWGDLQDRDKKLETIEDFFKGIVNELYGTDELDGERLEWYLDEIAHQLDMKLPARPMMVMRPEMHNG